MWCFRQTTAAREARSRTWPSRDPACSPGTSPLAHGPSGVAIVGCARGQVGRLGRIGELTAEQITGVDRAPGRVVMAAVCPVVADPGRLPRELVQDRRLLLQRADGGPHRGFDAV